MQAGRQAVMQAGRQAGMASVLPALPRPHPHGGTSLLPRLTHALRSMKMGRPDARPTSHAKSRSIHHCIRKISHCALVMMAGVSANCRLSFCQFEVLMPSFCTSNSFLRISLLLNSFMNDTPFSLVKRVELRNPLLEVCGYFGSNFASFLSSSCIHSRTRPPPRPHPRVSHRCGHHVGERCPTFG